MENILRKSLLIGLGALSLTKEKTEDLFKELETRGEESSEETKKFVKELMEKGEQGKNAFREVIRQELERLRDSMGLVTKNDLDGLERRLRILEERIDTADPETAGE